MHTNEKNEERKIKIEDRTFGISVSIDKRVL